MAVERHQRHEGAQCRYVTPRICGGCRRLPSMECLGSRGTTGEVRSSQMLPASRVLSATAWNATLSFHLVCLTGFLEMACRRRGWCAEPTLAARCLLPGQIGFGRRSPCGGRRGDADWDVGAGPATAKSPLCSPPALLPSTPAEESVSSLCCMPNAVFQQQRQTLSSRPGSARPQATRDESAAVLRLCTGRASWRAGANDRQPAIGTVAGRVPGLGERPTGPAGRGSSAPETTREFPASRVDSREGRLWKLSLGAC